MNRALAAAGNLGLVLGLQTACASRSDTGGFPGGVGGGSSGGGGDDTGEPVVHDCPAGMIEIPGGTYSLGERNPATAADYAGTIVPVTTMRLDAFCIDRFPLPGRAGDDWPQDGLTWDQVAQLEDLLPRYGRRLCSVSELMLAAAGPENWRLPYNPSTHEDGICDIEGNTPSALGTYSDCASPFGVRDFMVRSSWATFDPFAYGAVRPQWDNDFPGEGVYAIYGGTAALDTFFAPSNYGIHFYGPGDPAYTTDGIRTCAATGVPEAALDDAWASLMTNLARDRSLAAWIEVLIAGAGR